MTIFATPHLQERGLAWSRSTMKIKGYAPDAEVMTIVRDTDGGGKIVGAVVLDQIGIHTAQVHVVSDGSRSVLNRAVLRRVFRWIFDEHELRRVTGTIPAGNVAAQVMALKLGFTFEGRIRAGAQDGSDNIVMGMLASECGWLED